MLPVPEMATLPGPSNWFCCENALVRQMAASNRSLQFMMLANVYEFYRNFDYEIWLSFIKSFFDFL